jgi:hypothetical protein
MMDLGLLSPWLIGVVKAPISCLAFPKSLNDDRLPKEYNIMQKERLFRNIGCHRTYYACNHLLPSASTPGLWFAISKSQYVN